MDKMTLLEEHLRSLSNQRLEEIEAYIMPPLGRVKRSKEERVSLIIDQCKIPETEKKIFETVTKMDAAVLTAIGWLKRPSIFPIQKLLPQYTWQEITYTLFSLRQRLLIGYHKEVGTFELNPLFAIKEKLCHRSAILQVEENSFSSTSPFRNHFWIGLIVSFIGMHRDKKITNREYQRLLTVFPDIKELSLETVQHMFNAIFQGGALSEHGVIQKERILKFADYPSYWRIRSIQEMVLHIENLSIKKIHYLLPPGWMIEKERFSSIIKLYCQDRDIHISSDLLLKKLVEIRALDETDTHYYTPTYYKEDDTERVVITGDLSFAISPLFPLKKLIPLLPLLKTTHSDTLTHFEINKETFIRTYKSGSSVHEIIEQIREIFPEYQMDTIQKNLLHWESEHRQFSIVRGIILEVATESKGYMKVPDLAPYILDKLSPNRYLMSEEYEEEWRRVLLHHGVTDIFDTKKVSQDGPLPPEPKHPKKTPPDEPWSEEQPIYQNKDSESHINHANIGELGATVKGADFQGKMHMIIDAIKDKNCFLLLSIANDNDEDEELTIYPTKVSTDQGSTLIQGIAIPSREVKTVTLNRVFSITSITGHPWMEEFLPAR